MGMEMEIEPLSSIDNSYSLNEFYPVPKLEVRLYQYKLLKLTICKQRDKGKKLERLKDTFSFIDIYIL